MEQAIERAQNIRILVDAESRARAIGSVANMSSESGGEALTERFSPETLEAASQIPHIEKIFQRYEEHGDVGGNIVDDEITEVPNPLSAFVEKMDIPEEQKTRKQRQNNIESSINQLFMLGGVNLKVKLRDLRSDKPMGYIRLRDPGYITFNQDFYKAFKAYKSS
jgi:hypothetical protein